MMQDPQPFILKAPPVQHVPKSPVKTMTLRLQEVPKEGLLMALQHSMDPPN